jgi:hypothetical protein
MKDVTKQKIHEIRIEKIKNKSAKETFYWIYAHVDNKIKVIGRSTIKPKVISYNCIMD